MSEQAPQTVLLVDDDPAMLRLLRKWLEIAGYNVTTAEHGRDALAEIDRNCPNFLITDWEMPCMDGLELCRRMRAMHLPHYVFTLLLSSRAATTDLLAGLEAGADEYLKKPLDRVELIARLKGGARVIELERRLNQMANTDSLTGLVNRKSFLVTMDKEWARSKRYRVPMSCAMLDIDYFKRINDIYGHQVGDQVIREVANIMVDCCRQCNVVSRYGGEEFCILLPETTEEDAFLVSERIRARLRKCQIKTSDGLEITFSASVGVAQRMEDTASVEQLIDMADQALLVAKRSGRDRVVRFQSLIQTEIVEPTGEADLTALLRGVQAQVVMTAVVAPLREDDTLGSASQYFLRFRFDSAPVVDSTGNLVGMVSEKDIMAIMLWPNWWKLKIREAMKTNVVCYEEDAPAISIYEFLCRVTMRGVVVVKNGRPTGIINRGSLLRFFMNTLAVRRNDNFYSDANGDLEPATQFPLGQEQPLERIAQAVQALASEASDLQQRIVAGNDELVPCVVGGVSRVQELVNDLLSFTRFANEHSYRTKSGMASSLPSSETATGASLAMTMLMAANR